MRLMLEQGIILETYTGVAICFSFSIIIFIYKMQLVSELLVPNKVAPKNNLSLLANEGYKYLHDGITRKLVLQILNETNLLFLVRSLQDSEDGFSTYSFKAARCFYDKCLRATNVHTRDIPTQIKALETMLGNVSCFAIDQQKLTYYWESFSFYHQFSIRMKLFTQSLNEAGILAHYKTLCDWTEKLADFIRPDAQWRKFQEGLTRENNDIIRYEESRPIFAVFCLLHIIATARFILMELLDIRKRYAVMVILNQFKFVSANFVVNINRYLYVHQ